MLPPTPLLAVADRPLWLKLENLQPTGSFKVRGMAHAVSGLTEEQRRSGIATVSAGNAALAAAWAARAAHVRCKVVMYDSAPAAKREGVEALGAEVVAMPRSAVHAWVHDRGWESMPEHFIHPFADERIIAGTGSLGDELLAQLPAVRRVLVPVGGGGLACGVAGALHRADPAIEVIGVQSSGYPLWPRTFATGAPPEALAADTIADGTTAPYDATMHERMRTAVARWIEVPETELRRAVAELALRHKVVAEGAGALAYAAALRLSGAGDDVPTVAVVSGGNIDALKLADMLRERYAQLSGAATPAPPASPP